MNKIILFKFLLFSTFTLLSFGSFGQEQMNDSELTNDWQLLKTEKGIKFYVKKDNCEVFSGKEALTYVYFKIENTTNVSVKLTADFQAQYLEGCLGCAGQEEMQKTFVIPAKNSISESCGTETIGLSRLVKNPILKNGWTFKAVVIDHVKFI